MQTILYYYREYILKSGSDANHFDNHGYLLGGERRSRGSHTFFFLFWSHFIFYACKIQLLTIKDTQMQTQTVKCRRTEFPDTVWLKHRFKLGNWISSCDLSVVRSYWIKPPVYDITVLYFCVVSVTQWPCRSPTLIRTIRFFTPAARTSSTGLNAPGTGEDVIQAKIGFLRTAQWSLTWLYSRVWMFIHLKLML